ncbi:probable transmembrane ascorbate ferrireductase 4 isoform X2 [Momordica charantia]|uniref:Probable transmembrane ascorbate ferrireductase 4 isoform X2 n=1 Tax=Momordica charantia TaxID=3673 RepID=A0A6J1D9J8_MOMCH|nr:probable transmembrane ascorbate ferrireductase 4 isoform X2 [Momordica charantia]
MAATLASLVPLLIFARIFALLVAVLVFVWALAFSSSFHHRSPSREDHIFDVLHPLFMVIGLILLSGEAILVHSWLPGSRNLRKSVHLSLQGLALASGIIGIWTKFHRDRSFLANFHSLHSWMGLLAVTLFGAQIILNNPHNHFQRTVILKYHKQALNSCSELGSPLPILKAMWRSNLLLVSYIQTWLGSSAPHLLCG